MSRQSLAHQSSGTFPQRSESSHRPASVIYRELGNSRALRRQASLRWKIAFKREEAEERAAKGWRVKTWWFDRTQGVANTRQSWPRDNEICCSEFERSFFWCEVLLSLQTLVWTAGLALRFLWNCWFSPFTSPHFHTSLPVFSWLKMYRHSFNSALLPFAPKVYRLIDLPERATVRSHTPATPYLRYTQRSYWSFWNFGFGL